MWGTAVVITFVIVGIIAMRSFEDEGRPGCALISLLVLLLGSFYVGFSAGFGAVLLFVVATLVVIGIIRMFMSFFE